MNHAFLLEPGRWLLTGSWLERNQPPVTVRGMMLVAWTPDNWFTLVSKIIFQPDGTGKERDELTQQYRGRLDAGARSYTFMMQHSDLGRVEGEGWIAQNTILQRYWVLSDRQQRRSGFETIYRVNERTYQLSSAVVKGYYLMSAMEATLELKA